MKLDESETEVVPCPLCAEGVKKQETLRVSPFAVFQCCTCGMSYLSPRLVERQVRRLYESDSYYEDDCHGYTNYRLQEQGMRATYKGLLRRLSEAGKTGGSLLEVGCGYGYFLSEARDYFSTREGTEFSTAALDIAARVSDRVYRGGIESVPAEGRYSVVAAIQVLEHVYTPVSFVQECVKRLLPGGTLLIATPDYGSFWRYLMGRRWPSFKIPEHVLFFDKRTLQALVRRCGMTDLSIIRYPHAFPLALILGKFGIRCPEYLGRRLIWVPATTIALCAMHPK